MAPPAGQRSPDLLLCLLRQLDQKLKPCESICLTDWVRTGSSAEPWSKQHSLVKDWTLQLRTVQHLVWVSRIQNPDESPPDRIRLRAASYKSKQNQAEPEVQKHGGNPERWSDVTLTEPLKFCSPEPSGEPRDAADCLRRFQKPAWNQNH